MNEVPLYNPASPRNRCRANREQLSRVKTLLPENGSSQAQNLALTGLFVLNSLDSGTRNVDPPRWGCCARALTMGLLSLDSGDTTPCRMIVKSPVILHGVVYPDWSDFKDHATCTPVNLGAPSVIIQGYLAHKKTPTPLGSL